MSLERLSFSIVICTYNRDEFLERTLKSLNHLKYSNFEVVVVNGPSTDRTDQILEGYRGKIKIRKNELVNLSVSRNIGIKAAAGDVVAFLDDDAIPDPSWLNQIAEIYESHESIGGVGGRVYGPGGDHFQFHNGYVDVWGEATAKAEEPGKYTDPSGDKFNILMGVNSTFYRKHLLEVGGFDEYYEYFHDESDLCVRLTKSGYPIVHHQEAYVHHEFARSHIRRSIYHLNWYPIVKNTVYFGIKNSKGSGKSFVERALFPYFTARKRLYEFRVWKKNGNISKEDYKKFRKKWRKGVVRGYLDGWFAKRKTNYNLENDQPFLLFEKVVVELDEAIKSANRYGICLLSKHYPPYGSGGVGTYTKALAEELVKLGHPVYVLTSNAPEKSQCINGVNVIRVSEYAEEETQFNFLRDTMPVTYTNITYGLRLYEEVSRLFEEGKIRIVESPLWDYEGLALKKLDGLKLVVRLETPLRLAAQMQNWGWNGDLELSAQLESKLIELADEVITISQNVAETISKLYSIPGLTERANLVPLGLFNSSREITAANEETRDGNGRMKVLFVGRLEPRKGVDILLEAFKLAVQKYENVELHLVGNNTIPWKRGRTIEQEFIETADQNIISRVKFWGEVSDEQRDNLMQSCDVFVAPSRYESFGLVYVEAMSKGKPVIGCTVGGVPEIIDNEINGLLVPPEDAKSLANAILRLLTDRSLYSKMSINGQNKVREMFTSEKMALNTLKVYNEIIR
jgi:hypothetical protein